MSFSLIGYVAVSFLFASKMKEDKKQRLGSKFLQRYYFFFQ